MRSDNSMQEILTQEIQGAGKGKTAAERGETCRQGGALAACALLLMLVTTVSGAAQQGQAAPQQKPAPMAKAAPKAVAGETVAPEKESDAGPGIKIHGHWVLQVKNADGTLGDRREFDNSLVTGGAMTSGSQLMAALLSGNVTAGGLGIGLINGPTTTAGLDLTTLCNGAGSGADPAAPAGISCFGFVPTTFTTACTGFRICQGQGGLQEVVSFSPTTNIVISGNYTVPAALGALGTINAVQTWEIGCLDAPSHPYALNYLAFSGSNFAFGQSTINPQQCNAPNGLFYQSVTMVLTSQNVPPAPLAVSAGQVVQISVTLTFS